MYRGGHRRKGTLKPIHKLCLKPCLAIRSAHVQERPQWAQQSNSMCQQAERSEQSILSPVGVQTVFGV